MTVEVIRTPRGEMPTYVAAPAAGDPWPGVVVIHDFCGMSHDLRNQANWLAGEGYLAAAPDLYYWGSRLRCLWTIMREIAAGAGRTFDEIDSVRGWLVRHDRCTGKIGVIGFCMGGAYAVALAPGHGYAAASVNYGGCPKDAEQALAGACPIVGSYGGKDRSPMGHSAAPRLERRRSPRSGSTMMSRCIPARATDSSMTLTRRTRRRCWSSWRRSPGPAITSRQPATRAAASPPSSTST